MSAKIKKICVALGNRVEITAEAVFVYEHDPCYGADADGNRGVDTRWLVEVEIDKDSIVINDNPETFATLKQTNKKRILSALQAKADSLA